MYQWLLDEHPGGKRVRAGAVAAAKILVRAKSRLVSPGASLEKSNRHRKVLPLKTKTARFRIVDLE